MSPEVIYEDEDILAVQKPAGLQVHRTHNEKGKPRETLVDWFLRSYPEVKGVGDDPELRPGIVHRLDRDTSGVMLVAKNVSAFLFLKSLFKKREIKKTYLALVFGALKRRGAIDLPIGIKNGTVKRSVRAAKMAKEARTLYRVKQFLGRGGEKFALLEVVPETGRTHQIRVHLAHIGHPVVGDALYGRKKQPEWATRLMLHALALEFTSSRGGRLKIEAEPPDDFKKVLGGLSIAPPSIPDEFGVAYNEERSL